MKVLYIGYVREGSGWSRAAINNIRALMSAGVDVVYRDIRITAGDKPLDDDIAECERKDLNNVEVCIQHVLPKDLVKTGKYLNVAYLEYENHDLNNTSWKECLNMMDAVWVPNEKLAEIINENCKSTKGVYVPHACDITKYYESLKNVVIPELTHTYKFYSICDINSRKNIESTVKAFHAAFDRDEPVSLILKVRGYRQPEDVVRRSVVAICYDIKKRARLYKSIRSYKNEFIISGDISDLEVLALHQYADCFVNTSHGEAWSIPTFDAMAMGKQIISSPSGASQYLKDYNGAEILETVDTLCSSPDSPVHELYTGRDYWDNINEKQLVETMRHNYRNPASYRSSGLKVAKEYSLENVGKLMLNKIRGTK